MKTIHIIARTQFTYRSITIHLSLEHRPHTTCVTGSQTVHLFLPLNRPRPHATLQLALCCVYVSRLFSPRWLPVVISQAGCQSLYPKLVASRYIPSWLPVVISQAGCQSLFPTLVASRYIPSWFCRIQFNPITTLTENNYHIHVNNKAIIIISVYHLNYTKYDYRACHPTSSIPTMADTLYANNGQF